MTVVSEAVEFYRHYWACDRCGQNVLCRDGAALKREYDVQHTVRTIMAKPNDGARHKACKAVPRDLWPAVNKEIRKRLGEGQA